jgi:UDP-N-acetylmuramyl pentapeptide phosphotransferase/UDP-N-acetylglucosamine-1-phosphate transferase
MPILSSENARSLGRHVLSRLGFLDKPRDAERRHYVRHPCEFPVVVSIGSGAAQRRISAIARDVSVGGMLLECPDLPDGATRVHLEFEIPPDLPIAEGVSRKVDTSATVRYRDPAAGTASLAFVEPLRPQTGGERIIDRFLLAIALLPLLLLLPTYAFLPAFTKYVAVWSAGFLITLLLTPLLRRAMIAAGVVDMPDERRIHRAPTPRGGGLAIVLGFYAAAALALFYPWEWSAGSLASPWLKHFMIASGMLVTVGLLDDVRSLKPMVKLLGQIAASSWMFFFGGGMGRLLGFDLPLPLDYALTVFWFVALTNAFNLIDGLDGLATGLAIIASIGLMGAFFIRRMPSDAVVMIGFAGACVAFLRYNFHPASIFLGDTGSMFLGFSLASIAIATGSKGTILASLGVPLLAVGIPVFDTMLAIWRRSVRALAPAAASAGAGGLMQPDAEHLHHRLKRRGLNQYQVAVLLYIINAALVLTGLVSMIFRDHALGIFLLAFVVGAYIVVRHLAEVELWDTGRALIRGLTRPERKVAAFFLYPIADAIILLIALGFAHLMLHVLVAEGSTWEAWIRSVPVWVAPPFLVFCASRIYSRVWSLARSSDYLLASAALLGGVLISFSIAIFIDAADWRRALLILFIYASVAHVGTIGVRMAYRGLTEALSLWNEVQYYRRGGVVRRVLLYGSGGRCLLYLRERALNTFDSQQRRMIVGVVDDDTNLRFRRVGGYVVLGTGADLPQIIRDHRIDEIVITAQLRDESFTNLVAICALNGVQLSEWHYEERVISAPNAAPGPEIERRIIERTKYGAASASAPRSNE